MSEVKFKVSDITTKLGIKIANLEIQLANEQAAKEAYQKKVKDLEQEKEKLKTEKEEWYSKAIDMEAAQYNAMGNVCTCE